MSADVTSDNVAIIVIVVVAVAVVLVIVVVVVVMFGVAVGKADAAASLLAQQPSATDIVSDRVSVQPTQLAASYNIGMIDSHSIIQVVVPVHSLS